MKRRLTIIVIAALTMGVIFGATSMLYSASDVNADSEDQTFRWFAAAGVVDFPAPGGLLCDLGVPCPDEATAANGETIEIRGEGTLSIDKKGGAEDVDGGGTFTHNFPGSPSVSGTWKAKQLLSFDAYGPGIAALPDTWNSGRALILVRLKARGMRADAILEIGCRLPGSPGIPCTIEGIRLLLDGGQNFNMVTDPRSTLFIDITDQDDDDDD